MSSPAYVDPLAASPGAERRGSAAVSLPPRGTVGRMDVHLRLRPLSAKEGSNPDVATVARCGADHVVVDSGAHSRGAVRAQGKSQRFDFARVYSPQVAQTEVFDGSVRETVLAAFDGINGAVLAYGATGAGKTHTMLGSPLSCPGMILQAAALLYEHKAALEAAGAVVELRMAYYEIYNEHVYDLSVRQKQQRSLAVRDTGLSGAGAGAGSNPPSCEVPLLSHHAPESYDACLEWLARGSENRVAEETFANEKSSRSHAIMAVDVDVKDSREARVGRTARLKFCDLAGSERAAGTTNRGLRLREGANINRSLLALGAVVHALAKRSRAAGRGDGEFIPYRGSKLTRLLKDCLGGNCHSTLLVCVAPGSNCVEETLNTLNYATHAQKIEVTVKRNEFNDAQNMAANEALIAKLMEENQTLREEIRLRQPGPPAAGGNGLTTEGTQAVLGDLTPVASRLLAMRDAATDCEDLIVQEVERLALDARLELETTFAAAAVSPQPFPPGPGGSGSARRASSSVLSAATSHPASPHFATPGPTERTVSPLNTDVAVPMAGQRGALLASLSPSPGPSSARPSACRESPALAALQGRFNVLRDAKLALLTELRAVDEARDIQSEMLLREKTMTLAHVRAQQRVAGQSASVGATGAQRQIAALRKERAECVAKRDDVLERIGATDRDLGVLRKDALAALGPGAPLLERFEQLQARMDCLEAEELAAKYWQRACLEEQKGTEYCVALEKCTSLLKALSDGDDASVSAETRQLIGDALAYAALPAAKTDAMLATFQRQLEAAPTAMPLPRMNHRRSVRLELMEASPAKKAAPAPRPKPAPKHIRPPGSGAPVPAALPTPLKEGRSSADVTFAAFESPLTSPSHPPPAPASAATPPPPRDSGKSSLLRGVRSQRTLFGAVPTAADSSRAAGARRVRISDSPASLAASRVPRVGFQAERHTTPTTAAFGRSATLPATPVFGAKAAARIAGAAGIDARHGSPTGKHLHLTRTVLGGRRGKENTGA